MSFRSVQRVYFDDLDALNILHNVRYLVFVERARGELLASLGFNWNDSLEHNPDKYHVVAAHEVRYLTPVRGEQEIVIDIAITKLGSSSLSLAARVTSTSGDVVYATCASRLVRLDHKTNRPCPWSDRFRAGFAPLVQTESHLSGSR